MVAKGRPNDVLSRCFHALKIERNGVNVHEIALVSESEAQRVF
jgi:hypothetical protein